MGGYYQRRCVILFNWSLGACSFFFLEQERDCFAVGFYMSFYIMNVMILLRGAYFIFLLLEEERDGLVVWVHTFLRREWHAYDIRPMSLLQSLHRRDLMSYCFLALNLV